MKRSTTPSFSLEIKLKASTKDESFLNDCFFAGFLLHNEMVSYCKEQLSKLRSDKRYKEAIEKRRKARKQSIKDKYAAILKERVAYYGLRESDLYFYVKTIRPACIDSLMAQSIASNVYTGVSKVLYSEGKQVHFVKFNAFTTLSGRNNISGLKVRGDKLIWNKRTIELQFPKHKDTKARTYFDIAIRHRIKYVRLIRRCFSGRDHYYVQLVLEGKPPIKHAYGEGNCGIDIGTGSIAVVTDTSVMLETLNKGIKDYDPEIQTYQAKMSHKLRIANPGNYDQDGRIKKGCKTWKKTKAYQKVSRQKRSLERKYQASLKQHHNITANKIIEQSDRVFVEKMNFKALQKKAKQDPENPNKKRKRFGHSIKTFAPAMLLDVIDRKLFYEGKSLRKVNTKTYRASQYNHVKDEYVKKRLNERVDELKKGVRVQRDLYSAFLLKNANRTLEHASLWKCRRTFKKFKEMHDMYIAMLKASGETYPSSFGLNEL